MPASAEPNAPATPDRRALARALTRIEGGAPLDTSVGRGHAHIIGLTGAPGAGKSSLATALTLAWRAAGRTVAILSIDPSSPLTGGAILGDRIRMRALAGDPGVFIRSMASRGASGAIAAAASDAVALLSAAGFDIVLIETVGAGQSEIAITRLAHSVVLVEAPGMGDDIQAIKAGIIEIADVIVVNKADRPEADTLVAALRAALDLGGHSIGHHGAQGHHGSMPDSPEMESGKPGAGDGIWDIPVLKTSATKNSGIDPLLAALDAHGAFLAAHPGNRALERARREIIARAGELLIAQALAAAGPAGCDALARRVAAGELTPGAAARLLARPGAPGV